MIIILYVCTCTGFLNFAYAISAISAPPPSLSFAPDMFQGENNISKKVLRMTLVIQQKLFYKRNKSVNLYLQRTY